MRTALTSLLLALSVFTAVVAHGQDTGKPLDVAKASSVRSAYLMNFLEYTTWVDAPRADPQQPFVIGVCGEATLKPYLEQIAAKKLVHGRKVEVRRYPFPLKRLADAGLGAETTSTGNPADFGGCHILFIPEDHELQTGGSEWLEKIDDAGLLIIGEGKSFADSDAALVLWLLNGRYVFQKNGRQLQNKDFYLSSRLLRLARPMDP